jgi:hypothetical protein
MKMVCAIGGALALGVCSASWAESADADVRSEIAALRAQVQTQQSEIQQLRAASGDSWLNERRAEEVKTLVREVLSDADTRASLADGGVRSGYKGNFFLASEDGNFLLKILGQVQFRYIYNHDGSRTNDNLEGFSNRRTMIGFFGHLFDPKFTYGVSMLMSDDDELGTGGGFAILQNAWFAYEFADGWQVKGGQFKAPFAREELVHSSKQQAVERSILADNYTVDYTQGVQVSYTADMFRVMAMVHDGTYAANTDAIAGDTAYDFAIAARAELLLAGKWSQFDDFQAWSGESFGVLLGAAVDYEKAEGGTPGTGPDRFKWTADVSVKIPELMGLNLFGAVYGQKWWSNEAGQIEPHQIGFVLQAGIFVIPDKLDVFARYERLDLDGATFGGGYGGFPTALGPGVDDTLDLVTVGANYYFQRHAAKATVDVVYFLDDVATAVTPGFVTAGQGVTLGTGENEFAVRAQFQFLF